VGSNESQVFVSVSGVFAHSPGPSRGGLIDKSEIFKNKTGKMNYQNYIDSPGRGSRSRTFPKAALRNSAIQLDEDGKGSDKKLPG
jgi:hypothetical protein